MRVRVRVRLVERGDRGGADPRVEVAQEIAGVPDALGHAHGVRCYLPLRVGREAHARILPRLVRARVRVRVGVGSE